MAYLCKSTWIGSRLVTCTRRFRSSTFPLVFSEEVQQAKLDGKPIVALESTIITHGMPYPKNLETALEVENIIKQRGAVPATIAIIKGQLTVGLTESQICSLAQAKGAVKASRRDLAPIVASGLDGATTVAGTIVAAELADIPIFVTGGIGGVHREGETTLDISADLNELGRSATLVVCSGVKSILDIGKTLEYLETQGVCVCAFGKTNEFPAFYTVRSGHRAPYHVKSAREAAQILNAAHALQLSSGIVVAVPVPAEHAMDEQVIETAINKALDEAKMKNISGKEVTPFILAAVSKITAGASLAANIALIKNNAKVGADIAVEFKKLKNLDNSITRDIGFSRLGSTESRRHFHTSSIVRQRKDEDDLPVDEKHLDGNVLVIGGANVDRTYRVTEDQVQLDGSTHPCSVEQCGGGVGRNVAEALWRLRGGRARLLTALGDDADGGYLANIAPGLILDGCIVKGARTPTYAAVLDARGECRLGLGDMALHNSITPNMVDKNIDVLKQAPLVVFDGNIPQPTMEHILKLCYEMQKPVFFEPTDRRKAIKPLIYKYPITYASPNIAELQAMASFLEPDIKINDKADINEILRLSKIVSQIISNLIITVGSRGVITVQNKCRHTEAKLYPVKTTITIKNVSGAGDCFSSGYIQGILLKNKQSHCISKAFLAAQCALLSNNTVPKDITTNINTSAGYTILD